MSIVRSEEDVPADRRRQDAGALRTMAGVIVLIGAVGSVGLVFYAGRHNRSWFLIGLFAVWVLSPFIGLAMAHFAAKWLGIFSGATLPVMSLVIALGSLAVYGYVALGPPRQQMAFWFLIVPIASWVVILILAPLFSMIRRRLFRRRIEPIDWR